MPPEEHTEIPTGGAGHCGRESTVPCELCCRTLNHVLDREIFIQIDVDGAICHARYPQHSVEYLEFYRVENGVCGKSADQTLLKFGAHVLRHKNPRTRERLLQILLAK